MPSILSDTANLPILHALRSLMSTIATGNPFLLDSYSAECP